MSDVPKQGAGAQETARPTDAANWAAGITNIQIEMLPEGAVAINPSGKRLQSPIQGFGMMWQKTYRIDIGDVAEPVDVVKVWRERFPDFWPKGNRFYARNTISPGDVALLNLALPGHMKMATGMLILYADDESFTFMTPEGFSFAAFITFSSHKKDDRTIVQVQALIRASDPIWEMGMLLPIMHRMEDKFWFQTLRNIAAEFGVIDVRPTLDRLCIDRRFQWRYWRNVRHNLLLRTLAYYAATPMRWAAKPLRRAS